MHLVILNQSTMSWTKLQGNQDDREMVPVAIRFHTADSNFSEYDLLSTLTASQTQKNREQSWGYRTLKDTAITLCIDDKAKSFQLFQNMNNLKTICYHGTTMVANIATFLSLYHSSLPPVIGPQIAGPHGECKLESSAHPCSALFKILHVISMSMEAHPGHPYKLA